MQITVDCPTCGHKYQVARVVAGMKLKCHNCGATMVAAPLEVPRPPAPTHDAPAKPVGPAGLIDPDEAAANLMDQAVAFDDDAPSHAFDVFHLGTAAQHRRLAGLTSIILAAIVYLCSVMVIIGAFTVGSSGLEQALPAGTVGMLATLLGVGAAIGVALGTAYLVCGIKIRGEGFTAVLVAMLTAIIHASLIVLAVGFFITQWPLLFAAYPMGTMVIMAVEIVCLAALAALVYYSIRIIQVRR